MKASRPPIPAPMKREVRQRCGFGCVMCGRPIVEYHHMTPWEVVHEHKVDNITLLCDLHHKEATGDVPLLPEAQVREWDTKPINLKTGTSKPTMLHFTGPDCVCFIGGNAIVAPLGREFMAFMIDGIPLLGFRNQDGAQLLQFRYVDAANRLQLKIKDNELVFRTGAWDIDWTANRLTIRTGLGKIVLEIEFAPPDTVIVRRGELRLNGATIWVKHGVLSVANSQLLAGSMITAPIAINVGHDQFHRQLPAVAVAEPDPERLPGYELQNRSACTRCFRDNYPKLGLAWFQKLG